MGSIRTITILIVYTVYIYTVVKKSIVLHTLLWPRCVAYTHYTVYTHTVYHLVLP